MSFHSISHTSESQFYVDCNFKVSLFQCSSACGDWVRMSRENFPDTHNSELCHFQRDDFIFALQNTQHMHNMPAKKWQSVSISTSMKIKVISFLEHLTVVSLPKCAAEMFLAAASLRRILANINCSQLLRLSCSIYICEKCNTPTLLMSFVRHSQHFVLSRYNSSYKLQSPESAEREKLKTS